ncbi:MAG TPA: hypothetical protein PLW75_01145 [Hyphomicrobium sp.]|nr:hypothetical protein [Hyphomicrobium sp.]
MFGRIETSNAARELVSATLVRGTTEDTHAVAIEKLTWKTRCASRGTLRGAPGCARAAESFARHGWFLNPALNHFANRAYPV